MDRAPSDPDIVLSKIQAAGIVLELASRKF